jgi:TonB-linked SusC/RagA family outer membrane protein
LKAGLENPDRSLGNGYLSFRSIPMMLVYDPTNEAGGYGMDPKGFQGSNNVARAESVYERDQTYAANVSGNIDVMIIEGLHLNAFLGATLEYSDNYMYQYYYDDGAFASQRDFRNRNARNLTKIGTYTLNYSKKFGLQNISALVGYEARQRDFGHVNYVNRDAYVDEPQTSDVALGIQNQTGDFLRNNVLDRILSQFARVEYDYNGKYLLTANIRRDGYGSKFGPANRYGIFPGASVGWVVSKEDFMSQFSFINLLKVRAGYGLLGNAVGQDFAYTKYYTNGYNWDWSEAPGAVQKESGLAIVSKLANPDIQWEEVATLNLGLDISILNNRLTLALDYYSRQTKKMLYDVLVSPSAGVGPVVPANIGQMSNKGLEFQITHRNQVGDFSYDVAINGGFNKNELISLNPDLERLYIMSGNIGSGESGSGFYGTVAPARSEPGQPLGQFYGLQTTGIYDTDAAAGTRPTYGGYTPQSGDLIYVDQNDDGQINTDDYTQIGNPWPKLTYGVNLGASWKGIEVKATFTGTLGNEIYNAFESWEHNFFSDYNTTAKIYETSFFGTNGVTSKPRADNLARPDRNANWGALSDFHVEKGSYLRMRNLQVGYVLPSSVLNIVKIESARIYLSADNLFTLTKYTGMDPEIPAQPEYGGILSQGLDLTSRRYPNSRIISVGLNLKF